MVLGERRHNLGVARDESGVDTDALNELAYELVDHARVSLTND